MPLKASAIIECLKWKNSLYLSKSVGLKCFFSIMFFYFFYSHPVYFLAGFPHFPHT